MEKIILAIETSCDETSISVHRGHKLLFLKTVSQVDIFQKYGGVIPEIAARLHVETITPLFNEVIKGSKITHSDIDYIAFTRSPGLVNALQIGLLFAKTLKMLLNKPLIGVDHLLGHLLSPFIDNDNIEKLFPLIGIVISGGHTNIYYMKSSTEYELVGQTLDDSIGEAYDKVGHMLGMKYPSGKEIDDLTTEKKSNLIFKKSRVSNLDFSFSGIKSQVYREVEKNNGKNKIDIINAFQKNVSETLVEKIEMSCEKYNINNIIISGGVSASKIIRNKILNSKAFNNVYFPELKYCSDNAAMIGYAAYNIIKNNKIQDLNLDVDSLPRKTIN